MKQRQLGLIILLLVLMLTGCGSESTGDRAAWTINVHGPDGAVAVTQKTLDALADFSGEGDEENLILLERVLVTHGYLLIDHIVFEDETEYEQRYQWADIADHTYWLDNGDLLIEGNRKSVTSITVEPSAMLASVEASITDIAPTAAHALGIPAPAQASGQVLEHTRAAHVLMLFLDGFGYQRYREALASGLIPHLATLNPPLMALTTYPPITTTSSASLLTGTTPDMHAADQRGIRQTEAQTLFDVATEADLKVVAVEGSALAFNLRSAEITLSGDRDGDGSTDDNVLANTLQVLAEGMPDLFYVHFHGIDDAGHTYGPGTPEEETCIQFVDAAVGQILAALPPDTLVMIFADHGMHMVVGEERLGNHGHLIERDMLIPIFLFIT